LLLLFHSLAFADGPADNVPGEIRRIPKLGIEVPADVRQKLEEQLAALDKKIAELAQRNDKRTAELLPDVQIYSKAVGDALRYQEFFAPKELTVAEELLKEGLERADQLAAGEAPWTTAKALVVRGYVSKIDGSVQPYGLVVPESYSAAAKHRLDVWFHGRGEILSELNFVQGRRKQVGQFAPKDTIVLHPYGRYSNAFKFAGEVDVLEGIEAVNRQYRIDDDRVAVRGFSMGGAACWQFAVHYSDRWFAANPGAGFAETPEFLKVFQKETLAPTWYERKLWHWYDCTDWAQNLYQCPTVAYSGELDSQKQAADIMEQALAEVGIDLVHVIGPQTRHSYHPLAATEVTQRLDSLAELGRERVPPVVRFNTYTLKYNRQAWVTIDALEEHWERAEVHAALVDSGAVEVETSNVRELTLEMAPGWCPLEVDAPVELIIDEQQLDAPQARSDRSWKVQLYLEDDEWRLGIPKRAGLRKRHGLQGPIDDAFMDSFIFVRPTGEAAHEAVGKWAAGELEHAIEHWRRHFRGEARVKDDKDITDEDIAGANLVLWGDPSSNQLLAKIAAKLPISWQAEKITAGDREFNANDHALIAIYPNPLNPQRYVVLNSSFTFREFAYLNNARQVAKLPDWAVIDVNTPPNGLWPGKVVDADFFDEGWRLKPPHREKK
jgi:hypothetical protein